ncbi:MAG TPA: GGDEF domain-containing protein, partial [Paenalcaligenes sp.]|nr:GGDEF domain-containing protein [Paenalcaligenes sp.]
RQQVKVFHPLITISLGVVQVDRVQLYSGSLIAELATAAKANAKKMASNSLYIDRQEQASEPTAGSASRS